MRQRIASLGGTFHIGRVAKGGTAIEVFVPLHAGDAPADDGASLAPQRAESVPES
jgi:signal transduction histidine kinase